MSSSKNVNHVSQNEGDNLEMEGNNEDKCNIEEEDDDNLETDTSVEVDCKVFLNFWQNVVFCWVSADMVIAQNVSGGVWLGSNVLYQDVIQQL